MTNDEYHATPAMNATSIKAGRKSMRQMHYELTRDPPKEPTKPMRWGTLIHAAVLEPARFDKHAAVFDGDKVRDRKLWKEFQDENDAAWIMTADERDTLMRMSDAVWAHETAQELLTEVTEFEVPMLWTDDLGDCKAKPDGVSDGKFLLDLKSTSYIEKHAFSSQAAKLGYHIQFGWYRRAYDACFHQDVPFYVIAVESTDPFHVRAMQVPAAILDEGESKAIAIVYQYRQCERDGFYPGISEKLEKFELPVWATMDGADWSPNE